MNKRKEGRKEMYSVPIVGCAKESIPRSKKFPFLNFKELEILWVRRQKFSVDRELSLGFDIWFISPKFPFSSVGDPRWLWRLKYWLSSFPPSEVRSSLALSNSGFRPR
ncbi:hypothetical protein GQ457_14G001060 [Hibiscus cannabinus]